MDSRTPRKQDNGKRGFPCDTSPNPRDYSQNDRDDRHRSYRTGFFSNDRAHRQMSSKTGGDRWRDKSSPTRPKYDSFDSNLNNKNNNDQKLLMNHEYFEKWRVGVEFNVTSDKDEIVWQTKEQMDLYGLVGAGRDVWQTKEQMDLYGLVGGGRRKEDHFTGQIYERDRRPRSWSRQSRDKCRTRSLSRQSRDKTKKPLLGILKRSSSRPTERRRSRSRSVCFSQNNTFFEFERDAEMDVSKNDMEIDDKKYDISQKSKSIIASGKSNIMLEPMCFKSNMKNSGKEVLVNDLANDTVQSPVVISEEAIICPPNLKKNDFITPLKLDREDICSQTLDTEPLLKLNKKDKIVNAKHQRKFHGFDEKDISDDFGRLEMRTLLIQMQNKYEEDCQEFAENAYDVIVESTLGDRNAENAYDVIVESTLGDRNAENAYDVIVETTLGDRNAENAYDVIVETTLGDRNDVIVESTLGDRNDVIVESTLGDRNDVIVESTLGDRNQKSHRSSQVEVLNETKTTVLENNLSDSFQNYLIPIEDIFEDDTGHIVDENEPFMKFQDEEFNRETNLALTNMLTLFHSNDKSPPANTDLPLLSLDRHEPVQTDSNSEDKGQFEYTQPVQLDQQQLTQETKIDQSFLEQNSTDSVSHSTDSVTRRQNSTDSVSHSTDSMSQRPIENETLKTNEDNCIDVQIKDVNVKENGSDIVNHCLKKLHLYNLDQKTAHFKMKPVRICVEKIRLSKGFKKGLLSSSLKLKGKPFKSENPQVGALEELIQMQCASPAGVLTPATTLGSEFSHVTVKTRNPSRISVENAPTHLRKLRNSVQCSVCGTRVPAASTDLEKTFEAVSSWQCQDCTICVVCFVRDPQQSKEDGDPQLYKDRGGRLLVCSKCGLHYHKACIHLEEDQVGSWYVCQFCSTEKKN